MSDDTKTVLVSGATGSVGSQMVKHFGDRGWCVLTAGRGVGADVHFDLDNPEPFAATMLPSRVTLFVHAAASNEIECRETPYRSVARNILGTKAALDFCAANRIPQFCYVSTFHVFGRPSGVIDEDSVPAPVDDYGLSHLAAEECVCAYGRNHPWLHAFVVRPSNIYGLPISLDGFHRWSLVQYGLCREAVTQGSITLRTSGCQLRNFIAAEDLCEIVERMADDENRSVGLVHAAGPDTLSIRDLAGRIRDVVTAHTGKQVELTYGSDESPSSKLQFCSRLVAPGIPQPRKHIDEFLVAFCLMLLQRRETAGEAQ
ncbi:MAG TPA: SDR family oxidoreductase [Candidatus Cryosericum sp.]